MLAKVKFGVSEVFFGMLLAVAIFALGMVLGSSRSPQLPADVQGNGSHSSAANSDRDKITDWLLVVLNALLVTSTGLLFYANYRSAKIVDRALSQLERAHIVPDFRSVDPGTDKWSVQILLDNVGKSFGIVKGIYVQFAGADQLPETRPRGGYVERLTDTLLYAGQREWGGIEAIKLPTKQDGQIIYGHILYEDIFERTWRNRFAYQVWNEVKPGRDSYVFVGGAQYNAETQDT
jgi:hypothetical protein